MIERKCLNCGIWNKDEDFCGNCGLPISPKEIDRVETNRKIEEEKNKPLDGWDLLMEKMKNHQSGFVRFLYKVMNSIGIVFAAIGGFFAWLIAMANG